LNLSEKTASVLAEWAENNSAEGLTFYNFPKSRWRRIRASYNLERISSEIKRRTRVVGIFSNAALCLRLVSAILMEVSEGWVTGKVYLSFGQA
jgi:transposase-like protein